jgi:DNA-binding HxlR family transcriptional regulator
VRSYGQFCPVAKAAEVLGERWTLLVVRELLAGSHRFNELRHGVPLMSPTLLAKRLVELERAGIVERRPLDVGRGSWYALTEAGEQLRPVIHLLGAWGERWIDQPDGPVDADPTVLMWDVRRRVDTQAFPVPAAVVRFHFPDARPGRRSWWVVVDGEDVDVCLTDPGRPVDLTVTASLPAMVRVWLGRATLDGVLADGDVALDGAAALARTFRAWLRVPSRQRELAASLRDSGLTGERRGDRSSRAADERPRGR